MGRVAPPVFAAEALAFKLQGMSVRLCPSTIYRSVLRRWRCASVITCWTVDRESLTSFAIAAGLRPASNAARINRSCPGLTVAALSGSSGFARAAFAGVRFADRPPTDGLSGGLRPRRRTGRVRRSPPSSAGRAGRRPAGARTGPGRPAGRAPICQAACQDRARGRVYPAPAAARFRFPSFGP